MKDGEPWFVMADVCKALEVGNPSQTVCVCSDCGIEAMYPVRLI